MSDNWSEAAMQDATNQPRSASTEDLLRQCGEARQKLSFAVEDADDRIAHQAARIQELERREVLLTAFVVAYVEMHKFTSPFERWRQDVKAQDDALAALTDAGFPWPTEPVDAGAGEAEG